MRRRLPMLLTALTGLAAGYLLNGQLITAQQAGAPTIAAIATEKGGQDVFGPYEVAADWPKDLNTIPGHEAWTFGAGQSVFAKARTTCSSSRGELPAIRHHGRRSCRSSVPASRFRSADCRGAMPPRPALLEMAGQGRLLRRASRHGSAPATRWVLTRAGSTACSSSTPRAT